jgi:cytosine permease
MLDYFLNKADYAKEDVEVRKINWAAIAGVVAGALVGNFVKWGIAAINAMVVACIIYYFGTLLFYKNKK